MIHTLSIWSLGAAAFVFLFLAFKPGIQNAKWYHDRFHYTTVQGAGPVRDIRVPKLADHCTWCDEVRENAGIIS